MRRRGRSWLPRDPPVTPFSFLEGTTRWRDPWHPPSHGSLAGWRKPAGEALIVQGSLSGFKSGIQGPLFGTRALERTDGLADRAATYSAQLRSNLEYSKADKSRQSSKNKAGTDFAPPPSRPATISPATHARHKRGGPAWLAI